MIGIELTPEVTGDTVRVAVRGEIDASTVPQVRELLEDLVGNGAKHLVLECSELTFLDSSGIGLLVATRKQMGADGDIVIDSPPSHIRKVLELTGVTSELVLRP